MNNNSIYKEIANKYYNDIYKYCYYKLGYHREDAEECTQEVFMILLIKWKSLSSHENIRGWLYRVADNVMRNYSRKSYKYKSELSVLEDISLNIKYNEYDGAFDILSILTIAERNLLKECYLDKATAKELSDKYKISENAIYVKIHRIKIKLKKILDAEKYL